MAEREATGDVEDHYRLLFETAPDVAFVFEAEGERRGRIVAANRRAIEEHGYSLDELLAMTIMDLDAPSEAFEAPVVIERVLRGETVTAEMMHRRKDGSLFMSEVCARLVEHQGRRLVVAHERDISRRKQAESALDNERRMLQAVLDRIPVGVFVVRAPDGHTLLANHRAAELLGRTIEPAVGRHDLAGAYKAFVRGTQEPYPEERMPLLRGLSGETTSVEDMEIEHPDGHRVLLEVVGGPIQDARGEITSSVAVFQDVTARRSTEERRRLNERRLNSLLELSQRLGDLSEADIVQQAIEEAVSLTGSEIGYLHFVNPDQHSIRLKTWSRRALEDCTAVAEEHYPLEVAGVWADCVRLGRPVIHNDYQAIPDRKGYPEGHSHVVRHASAPIFDGERAAIVIGVGNKAQAYDDSDARQLILIGDQLLRILQRKRAEEDLRDANRKLLLQLEEIGRLQAELREQASRDPLTGLLNRRSMGEELERELIRAAREHHPIAVVMIDIDHFKSINDALGHEAGDKTLSALAALLRAQTRRTDAVCRLGGDEFLVLMPRASCELAAVRAGEWRADFEALAIPFGERTLRATLSIGVAGLPPGKRDVDAVLREADRALYESKAAGRNRVTVSSHC